MMSARTHCKSFISYVLLLFAFAIGGTTLDSIASNDCSFSSRANSLEPSHGFPAKESRPIIS